MWAGPTTWETLITLLKPGVWLEVSDVFKQPNVLYAINKPIHATMEFNVAVTPVLFVALFVIPPVTLDYFKGIVDPYIYISVAISPVPDAYMLDFVPEGIDEDVIVPVFWSFSSSHEVIASVLIEFQVCAQVVLFHEFPPGKVLAVYLEPTKGQQQEQERT